MRARYIIFGLIIVLTSMAAYLLAAWQYRSSRETELPIVRPTVRQTYDDQISWLGEELAEAQYDLGHATYFIIGLPSADKMYKGMPACQLGCIDFSLNDVNVRRAFIDAYNRKLDYLRNQGKAEDPSNKTPEPTSAPKASEVQR